MSLAKDVNQIASGLLSGSQAEPAQRVVALKPGESIAEAKARAERIKGESLNGYVCFYKGKRAEVYAPSLYAAKLQAINIFSAPRSRQHMISVVLAEKAGVAVEIDPASL